MKPVRGLSAPALLALSALLGACASNEPYAMLDGQKFGAGEDDEESVSIVAVDGGFNMRGRDMQAMVTPGAHLFVLQTHRPAAGGSRPPALRYLPMKLEACKRYLVLAKHHKATDPRDWDPILKQVEPIAPCGPAAAEAPASAASR